MSFLDNLESNLKNLESREEGAGDAERERRAREKDRADAQAAAPYAEELKKSEYTAGLLRHATRAGHELRTKVHIVWLGSTLRLEARERRLELRPTGKGVMAVFLENNQEKSSRLVDLKGNPEDLARQWLAA
ncbi:MAG TPA: hypothetical protein VG675_07310 [Bryobacteraceae bacterium]|nr:hypothetical protein [Bryobacteraceae bacterium]